MYVKHCKIRPQEQRKLIEHFVAGTTARTAADLIGIHRNSAIRYYHKLREKIAVKQQNRIEQFCGKIELDESYFGGVRKGKRGRGSAGKVPVFGILKRGGKVYTQTIENTKAGTLMPIIRDKKGLTALYIQIAIVLIMLLMFLGSNIFVLIIQSSLLIHITTSMV
jgi:transposase